MRRFFYAIFEAMKVRLPKDENIRIANTEDIARIMCKILLRQNRLRRKKEYFWTVGLSNSNDIEYIELIAVGTLNKVILDPVDIFNFAVAKKCKKLILVHNHPSGDLTPSVEDVNLTKTIILGANTLKIKLLDHIIISETGAHNSIINFGHPYE